MELKVWTDDGVSRIVSGISEVTTCKDVMVATAQVTGGVGRYCMTVCYDNVCKKLNPTDRPLEVFKNLRKTSNNVKLYVNSSNKTTYNKLKSKVMEVHPSFPAKECFDHDILQDNNMIPLSKAKDERFTASTFIQNTHGDKKKLTEQYKTNILQAGYEDQLDYEHFQEETQNKKLMTLISNEMTKFEELQERLQHLKSETIKEEIIEEQETQKIKSLLKYISELQNNCHVLDKELEEFELVSWKEKLEMETTKEVNLQSELIEAKRDADGLQVQISRLDDEIEALKSQIEVEEDTRKSHETEIESLKKDFEIEKDKSKNLEEQLQKLDDNMNTLEKNIEQGKAEFAAKLDKWNALQRD